MENIITIELFGEKYSFKAETEVTNAHDVADIVSQEVKNVEKGLTGTASNVNKMAILTMASLNIAKEYLELKQNHSALLDQFAERSASLIGKIDANL